MAPGRLEQPPPSIVGQGSGISASSSTAPADGHQVEKQQPILFEEVGSRRQRRGFFKHCRSSNAANDPSSSAGADYARTSGGTAGVRRMHIVLNIKLIIYAAGGLFKAVIVTEASPAEPEVPRRRPRRRLLRNCVVPRPPPAVVPVRQPNCLNKRKLTIKAAAPVEPRLRRLIKHIVPSASPKQEPLAALERQANRLLKKKLEIKLAAAAKKARGSGDFYNDSCSAKPEEGSH